MSRAPYEWWQSAISGTPLPIHDDPECGYYKVRDRRGANKDLAAIKRPWVAAAIWLEGETFRAELGGDEASVETLWPYCAKNPIPFEDYEFWHQNGGTWPQKAAA